MPPPLKPVKITVQVLEALDSLLAVSSVSKLNNTSVCRENCNLSLLMLLGHWSHFLPQLTVQVGQPHLWFFRGQPSWDAISCSCRLCLKWMSLLELSGVYQGMIFHCAWIIDLEHHLAQSSPTTGPLSLSGNLQCILSTTHDPMIAD